MHSLRSANIRLQIETENVGGGRNGGRNESSLLFKFWSVFSKIFFTLVCLEEAQHATWFLLSFVMPCLKVSSFCNNQHTTILIQNKLLWRIVFLTLITSSGRKYYTFLFSPLVFLFWCGVVYVHAFFSLHSIGLYHQGNEKGRLLFMR